MSRHKEQKESKHKDMKRDKERDRDRDRGHDRSVDRIRSGKDDRISRDSGGYSIGHYSRDDDHWLSRDGRDMRDNRYVEIHMCYTYYINYRKLYIWYINTHRAIFKIQIYLSI